MNNHIYAYSKDIIKGAKNGFVINGVNIKGQHVSIWFRNEFDSFDNNLWYISLQGAQLQGSDGCPQFFKLYEYARKLKDALELDEQFIVTFKSNRVLSTDEYDQITEEVVEHDRAFQTIERSNGTEIHHVLDDYDDSDL